MQCSRSETLARPFVGCRNPSSFPVRIRHNSIGLIVSLAAVLLMSAMVSPSGMVRAEPATAVMLKTASDAGPYAGFVREAAQRFAVPASWIGAVMAIESGGDVRAFSPQGAMGLMQIMPETWAGLRVRHDLGDNPYDPRDNILAGAAYLRELYDRYGSPGFLAAYNAGPGRYDEHLSTGRALPHETQLYVATLAPLIGEGQVNDIVAAKHRIVSWRDAPLFVVRDQDESFVTPAKSKTSIDRPSDGRSAKSISLLKARTDSLFVRSGKAVRLP